MYYVKIPLRFLGKPSEIKVSTDQQEAKHQDRRLVLLLRCNLSRQYTTTGEIIATGEGWALEKVKGEKQ